MHPLIETVYKAADTFMSDYVTINDGKIASFQIADMEESTRYFSMPPYLEKMKQEIDPVVAYKIVHIFNAIQASVQYSFFTARADIRLDGVDSQWVINMIDAVFAEFGVRSVTDVYRTKGRIVERLTASGITMLRSRVETVEEVFAKLNFYEYGEAYADVDASLTQLSKLVCFKQDLFFKKGLFSLMMTGRMLPELSKNHPDYAKAITSLPVPADYQIPKMLRHYGLITFGNELEEMVENNILLPENSEPELNIRAATVKACKLIAERNAISADAVDARLFAHREESSLKHHLCVTEFY